jgi:hypothetical protein
MGPFLICQFANLKMRQLFRCGLMYSLPHYHIGGLANCLVSLYDERFQARSGFYLRYHPY